ncbi:acyltransferase family protein [Inhella sp.]|uniref:acyltransferase family protein n=1 Tax=Inhella sp. TaxID=1921806 RepID=UPI0035B0DA1A
MPDRHITPDLLKSLAAWLIVMHHAVLYGPLAQALHQAWPGLAGWLVDYGRYAVQVFLVTGGYLAAQGLMRPEGAMAPGRSMVWSQWTRALARRHARLAWPFMVAVLLVLLTHALTDRWIPDLTPSVSAEQVLAHALLLHGVLGFESLTVGAWYVAIDLQLYALLALILGLGPSRVHRGWCWGMVLLLSLASLWGFNRDERWDGWALYFFGSYAMGVGAAALPSFGRWQGLALLAGACVLGVALAMDFRGRLLLAGATALALLALPLVRWPVGRRGQTFWQTLWQTQGERSYALFLVHFAVCLAANAGFVAMGGAAHSQGLAGALMLVVLWASGALARVFHLRVERPLARWQPWEWVKAGGSSQARGLRALGLFSAALCLPWGLEPLLLE